MSSMYVSVFFISPNIIIASDGKGTLNKKKKKLQKTVAIYHPMHKVLSLSDDFPRSLQRRVERVEI